MSVMGLFLVLVASIVAWWLARQGLMQSPWLAEGSIADLPGSGAAPPTAAKIGLGVFLTVVGCLFALLASAYYLRMAGPDWQAPPAPGILWFNTAVLIASSVALHLAQRAANRGQIERVRIGLLAGGVCALVFLAGQLLAWRQMSAQGFFVESNPANSFFYLFTGIHALHIAGGLAALAATAGKAWRGRITGALRENVELCAIYWHFLLFVWFALFAMLTGWTNEFGVICRRVLS